ncbi:hypothetical protein F6J84_04900 [Microbacterium caowuchunii]|uniref:hypothetical protein n=1 Tax=Microbacterium caowuchunii TaxID=2614638 RepID=UPI00124416B7|nr:hypothetical protein [Microbacterium caowuchunii]QEV99513.1 hypothetical protein F6J84_04900 [Microbacterium caowuchunii]
MYDRITTNGRIPPDAPTDGAARPEPVLSPRQRRAARRHAYWEELSEFLLSIPAGVGIRIGG